MAIDGKFKGLCLEVKYNYLWDGDFCNNMLVWNPESKTVSQELVYDSRGFSSVHEVDATPEVKQEYADYLAAIAAKRVAIVRQNKLERLVEFRAQCKRLGVAYGFKAFRLLALRNRYNPADYQNILDLLEKNIRSGFKKSLRQQLVNWLADENPNYATPLSPKQVSYLVPVAYGYNRRY